MFGFGGKQNAEVTKQQVFRALVDAGVGRTLVSSEEEELCEFSVSLEVPESDSGREEMGRLLTSSRLREVFATVEPGTYVVSENLRGQVEVFACENANAYRVSSRLV